MHMLRSASLGLFGALALDTAAAPVTLPAYDIDPASVSVSGISSGGYMAVQMHVAYSTLLKGAGVIAAGPYSCAQTGGGTEANLQRALGPCMQGAYPFWRRMLCSWGWLSCPGSNGVDVAGSVAATRQRAERGEIDPVSNLDSHRVMLLSGTGDDTVVPAVVDALNEYYRQLVPPANVRYERLAGADHTFPTDSYTEGNLCSIASDPYISDCRYDAAGQILKHLYGALQPRNEGPSRGELIEFDQVVFVDAPESKGMARTGWVYVPETCATTRCRLHVVFHGCKQSASTIERKFVEHAGYNRWADTNDLIVLYPQTIASSSAPLNPNGCWDWWGYTDAGNWDTKRGAQLQAVKGMVDRLAAPR